MAGYVIHLAVGEEYLRIHTNEIQDYEQFIEGIIYPDSVTDKSLTHYGSQSSKVNLMSFLKERNLDDDFNKGYFIHLVTDYLFYNKFLTVFSKKYIYNDYDILNSELEIIFQVKIPSKIRSSVFYKNGNPKILNLNSTINFIKEVANYSTTEIKNAVLNNDEKWLKIKELVEIE